MFGGSVLAMGKHQVTSETQDGAIRYTFDGLNLRQPFNSLGAVRAWCKQIKAGNGGFDGDTISLHNLAKKIEEMAVTEVRRGNLAP